MRVRKVRTRRVRPPSSASSGAPPQNAYSRAIAGNAGASAALAAAAAAKDDEEPLGFLKYLGTPFQYALETVSQPMYGIGNAIAGRPNEALKNMGALFTAGVTSQIESTAGRRTLPSEGIIEADVPIVADFLREGIPGVPGSATTARILTDVGFDPASYVTFGQSGAVRAAGRAAEMAARKTALERAVNLSENVGQRAAVRNRILYNAQPTPKFTPVEPRPLTRRGRQKAIDEAPLTSTTDILRGQDGIPLYDETTLSAQATMARTQAIADARADVAVPRHEARLNIPFAAVIPGVKSNSRRTAEKFAAGEATGKPLRRLDQTPVLRGLSSAKDRMTPTAVEIAANDATLNMVNRGTKAMGKSFTRSGGLNKAVSQGIVQAGHQNNRIDETAGQSASAWLRNVATRAQEAGVIPKKSLTKKADVENVMYGITVEAELPKIIARNPEVAGTGKTVREVAEELGMSVDDVAYAYAQSRIKNAIDVQIVDRPVLLQHFSDDVTQFRQSFDDMAKAQREAGVIFGHVDDYVPHYPMANNLVSRAVLRKNIRGAKATVVNPLTMSDSIHERSLNDILQWFDEGLTPELNAAEIFRLRAREAGRTITAKAGNDAVAANYGILDARVLSDPALLRSDLDSLDQYIASLKERYDRLSARKVSPEERAAAWRQLQSAYAARKKATDQRPFRDLPDSPMTSPRLPVALQEAIQRGEAARNLDLADDVKVRAANEAIADAQVRGARQMEETEALLQRGGIIAHQNKLSAAEREAAEAVAAADAQQIATKGRLADEESILRAAQQITRTNNARTALRELLDDITDANGQLPFLSAADQAKLDKALSGAEKAESRLASMLDTGLDAARETHQQVIRQIEAQVRAVENAEATIALVADRANRALAKAEKQLNNATMRAAQQKQARMTNAQRTQGRIRSEAKNTEAVAEARKAANDARAVYQRARDLSNAQVGTAAQFRSIGKRMEKAARTREKIVRRLDKAEMDYRRAMTVPVNEVVTNKQFIELTKQAGIDNWVSVGDKVHYANIMVPPEIRAATDNAWERVFGTLAQEPGTFTTWMRQATSAWKSLALMTPGYLIRNAMSDMMMMYLGGFRDLSTLKQAWDISRKTGPIEDPKTRQLARTLIGKGERKPGPNDLTYEQIRLELETQGLRQIGFAGAEGLARARNSMKGTLAWSAPGKGRVATKFQNANESRENFVRAAMYLDGRKQGMSINEARERTLDWLFDYADVAPTIAAARRFWVPFIVYPTKAIPAISRALVQRPGFFANYNALTEEMNIAAGYPDLRNMSASDAGGFAVPLPGFMRGALGGSDGPFTANVANTLPWGSLDTFVSTKGRGGEDEGIGGMVIGLGLNTIGQMNPLAGAAAKAANQSTYSGRGTGATARAPAAVGWLADAGVPIPGLSEKTSTYDGKSYAAIPNWASALLGTVPTINQFDSYSQAAAAPFTDEGLAVDEARSRLQVLRALFGVNISPYDVQKANYYASNRGG